MNKPAFAPHQIQRAQLKAINRDVIVTDMVFEERITTSGIIIPTDNGTSTGIRPRWGQVYAVGAKQQDVKPGDWICIAHGRWTRGLDIEDESGKRTIRKIEPNDILLISDERPNDMTFSDAIHVEAKPTHMQHN